jgi:hypothetical protein
VPHEVKQKVIDLRLDRNQFRTAAQLAQVCIKHKIRKSQLHAVVLILDDRDCRGDGTENSS